MLDIDLHKGMALNVIQIEELLKYSWEAYQERLRIDRKFKKVRLENDLPSKSSMHSGWTSLTKEQGQKMRCKTWFKSMLKYATNPLNGRNHHLQVSASCSELWYKKTLTSIWG